MLWAKRATTGFLGMLALVGVLAGCGGSRPSGDGSVAADHAAQGTTVRAYRRLIRNRDLQTPDTGGLTGTVRDASDNLRDRARVSLLEGGLNAPEVEVIAIRTRESGEYGFADIPLGTWRVRCRWPDGSWDVQVHEVRRGTVDPCNLGGDKTVETVVVRPKRQVLQIGDVQRYRTEVCNPGGHLLTGVDVDWTTHDPMVASINGAGRLEALTAGWSKVKAVAGGVLGKTRVTVAGSGGSLDNLFFLHHSTGDGIITEGNVRGYIGTYNSTHATSFEFWDHGYNWDGLRNAAGTYTGTDYAIPGDNTDPDGLHYLWTSSETEARDCRDAILANHEVIAFKSCFPASGIPDTATLNQYKAWYVEMRGFFDKRPDKVFVVMSTPPLHRLSTDATEAANARAFANWLKSAVYLQGYPNVVCFDLFDLLAKADDGSGTANMLRYAYEGSHGDGDSHPNAAANAAVGPVFAQALIDAATPD